MAENTRLKDLQATVMNHTEELHRLNHLMESRFTEHDDRMDQIQRALQQILLNTSPTDGSNSNSGSSMATQNRAQIPVKEISLDLSRVDIAAMHFEKDVVPWFQMLHRISAISSWLDLTRAMESQFGPSPYDCPMSELFKLTQTGSISDYYLKFMALANRSIGLSDEALLNCFVGGLHKEIKRDVIAMAPPTLLRAVALARLYEERYTPVPKAFNSNYTHKYSPISSQNVSNATNSMSSSKPMLKSINSGLLPTPVGPSLRNSNVKRISPSEMQLRREKGLCYFCDNKFTFNHKCPNRQLLFLQTEEDEEEYAISDEIPKDEQVLNHHLSLNALKGGLGVGTIRFVAHIGTLPIIVLIDGGSSDNFLQPRIAKFLKLPIEPAPRFRVMVGNGNYMAAEGVIQELKVHAQGNYFQLPVFLLPISGADLILGACWLKTIGPHIADYEALQLKFMWHGKFTSLRGDPELLPKQAEMHHLRRMINTDAIAEIFSMQVLEDQSVPIPFTPLSETLHPDLALLLHNYKEVFDTPTTLPPSISHDHSIPLLQGSNPVKVKPYRYPHSHKEEIERLSS
ncbi:PREDICTED: uncharacterized protein LOC109359827 [Lupinus angustifolius]|uniref:uncharacterized protein LOC109359827 n=1 Tax=Lupinus angustifolius TaxID=3871 RepID=UPI00092E89C0|nr:PREDICTED: uncharacterized protein LOC109359827 [Lupinus angustifolius]